RGQVPVHAAGSQRRPGDGGFLHRVADRVAAVLLALAEAARRARARAAAALAVRRRPRADPDRGGNVGVVRAGPAAPRTDGAADAGRLPVGLPARAGGG